MNKAIRILFLTALFSVQILTSFADRGAGKKRTSKVNFNIKTPISFNASLKYNLKNGLKYTGSFSFPTYNYSSKSSSSLYNFTNFVTYQKGNTTYIIPYKQKVFVADFRYGFAGTKLIIKIK